MASAKKRYFKVLCNKTVKILTITLDNASNNDSFIQSLIPDVIRGGEYHIRCFAHVANLAAQDALKSIEPVIQQLRMGIKCVRMSTKYLESLEQLCAVNQIPFVKPILDVKTRWNSTFDMLVRALRLRVPLDMVFSQINGQETGDYESDGGKEVFKKVFG